MAVYKDCIMFNLAKAYQRVHGEFKARFAKYGLTPMQLLVIEALCEEEGLSSGEIGKRLILDSATLSGVLDRLLEAGWIVKNVSASDRRVLEICLSDKARSLKDRLLLEVVEANQAILQPFRMEEQLLLKRILEDLKG